MKSSLRIENLTMIRGGKTLCRQLNFTISPGESWGVLGPNGCGKSTLLHTISGHLPPAAGNIFLNTEALTSLSARRIAQEIGILFQDAQYTFPQSVFDYCLAGRFPHHGLFSSLLQDKTQVEQALLQLELTALAEKNIQELSGGEQRRAAMAALFVQAPAFLLLDEPANHLDLRYQIHIMKLLASRSDCAIILSAHDINFAARFCNRILMMFPDGECAHGLPGDMLTTENLSRLYQYPIDALREGKQTYWVPA